MRSALGAMLMMAVGHAESVSGHYVLQGGHEIGSELMLKPDGTFEYMLAYGAADYWARGTWRLELKAVVLNSAGKEQPPFRLVKSSARQGTGVRVWVKAPNGQPVPHIEVAVQDASGSTREKTTAEGAALFPGARQPRTAAFRVPVYQVEAGPFEIDPAHNDFYFEINGDAITQVLFQNERLPIEGSALMLHYWNKEEPMRYEKQHSN